MHVCMYYNACIITWLTTKDSPYRELDTKEELICLQ